MTIYAEAIRDAAEVLDTLTSRLPAAHPLRVKASSRAKTYVAMLYSTADEVDALRAENQRLQRIIDSRPAINAGLPQTYIEWSHSIYAMEAARVLETPQ